jgi:hypothetical protein
MATQPRRTRRSSPPKSGRNTAPLWKKLTIVLSAAIAVAALLSVLRDADVGLLVLAVSAIAVVAAVVWLVAKLLVVRPGSATERGCGVEDPDRRR